MTTPTSPFTILIHPDLVNELDEHHSPADGIAAIDQLYLELPRLHAAAKRRSRKHLRLYRARYRWSDLGFSYVQVNDRLHVVELWMYRDEDLGKQPVDVVLGN